MARIRCGLALGILFAATTAAAADGTGWWQLVSAQIDEAPAAGATGGDSYGSSHPVDLKIPKGWELRGQSENPGTRSHLRAKGVKVGKLPPTGAADYLRAVLLPRLHPGARVLAIERLPKVAANLNAQLSATNTADAARARITYQRNGAAVEEWREVAVEHLQEREDLQGPMIDTFMVVECDSLWAPAGTLEQTSRILASVLGTLHENYRWDRQASVEYWHGKYTDLIIHFLPSYFAANSFIFEDTAADTKLGIAFRYAWSGDRGGEFIVTDAVDSIPIRRSAPNAGNACSLRQPDRFIK